MARHKDSFNYPKVELHCHVGGSFRPQTFLELAMEKEIDLDKIDFYNVNIETAFNFFIVGSQLVQDLVTLRRIVRELIEDYGK
jgi:adenosine deaminase